MERPYHFHTRGAIALIARSPEHDGRRGLHFRQSEQCERGLFAFNSDTMESRRRNVEEYHV